MSGDLAAFLLARIAEDEQRGGRSREHPRDVDCPCGKRGTLDTLTFNGREQSAEIVHVVGWAPRSASGGRYWGGESVTATHVLSDEQTSALVQSWPLSRESVRVLDECEAKRRIIALHFRTAYLPGDDPDDGCVICGGWPCDTLRALAAPYAGHPDFDPAWRL